MGTRTAYVMYTMLTWYFGLRNFADCDELANSLLQSRCDHNRVQDYVARWHAWVARLSSAKYRFSTRVLINAFVKSLPNTITFATLRAFLPDRLASWDDLDIGSFILITNEVMDLEVAFWNSSTSSSSLPRSGHRPPSLASQMLAPPPSLPNSTTSTTTPSSDPPSLTLPLFVPSSSTRPSKSPLNYRNCKACGLRSWPYQWDLLPTWGWYGGLL